MVFRGRDTSRARGRSRPFRFRGRGVRRPYVSRGSSRGGHDRNRGEGLRITLRNDAASYNRHDRSDDRESDRFEEYGEEYDDYNSFGKEERDRRTPTRDSRNSPPRKRQHIESDLLEDESLRITVGNDLYKKDRHSPSADKQGSREDRSPYAGDRWDEREMSDRLDDRRKHSDERGYGKSYDFDSAGGSKPYFRNRDPEESSRGRGRPFSRREYDHGRSRGRGRDGDGGGFRERRNYSPFDQDRSRSERYSHSPSRERRRSRSYSRERHGSNLNYRRPRSRSYSPEKRNYSPRRRSYSHGRRSNSRDWRSSSRGRSYSRERRSYSTGSRSPRRSSIGRRRSLPRNYSPGRRPSRSQSRSRSRSLRRSHSRGRSYSRSPRSYSRSSSRSGRRGRSRSRSGSTPRRYSQHPSPPRTGPPVRRSSIDHRSPGRVSHSRSSSSSSSSSSNRAQGKTSGMSEKEYEEEMFRRLKAELTATYSNPNEREERIAKHIREMAKISPVLFRNFMSKNAGNLAALTTPQEEREEKENPVEADPAQAESCLSDPSQSRPLRSILKRKEDSLSPSGSQEPETVPEQPMSNIEKVIHSLRKGAGALEKESALPVTTGLKQLSSYMDIEDEEEFLYGEEAKSKKENPESAVPFWSAHRFEEDKPKSDFDMFEDHPRPESEKEVSKTASRQKAEDVKRPLAFDDLEDKEKIYEQWRATVLQKGKREDKEGNRQAPETSVAEETEASDLSSTVKNILESIGFNFDLSRRMQELARQKKEQEQTNQSITINQTASFLGAADMAGSIKTNIFQQEPKNKPSLKADVASLVEEVRQATRLAQEKAKKAKQQEERHMHASRRQPECPRDSLREDVPKKESGVKKEPEAGDTHEKYKPSPAGYPYNTFGASSYESYMPAQQYSQYHEYTSYGYLPPSEEEYVPDYEDPHQPKPIRASNLISLAGEATQSEGKTREDEFGKWPNDHADSQYKDASKSEKKQGDTSSKKPGERILIVRKKVDSNKGDSPGEEKSFSRRIVLPPKEKLKPTPRQGLELESPKEAPKKTESVLSSSSDSSSYRETKRRGSSPDPSLRQPKQSRFTSPEHEKKDQKKEPEAPMMIAGSHAVAKDIRVDSDPKGSQKKDVISVAKEKALKLKQDEERKRKLAVLHRELSVLKQQHNDLLRKRRRQRDGHKDPLLVENCKLQDEINAQIRALERGEVVAVVSKSPPRLKSPIRKELASAGSAESIRKKQQGKEESEPKQKEPAKEVPRICYEYFDPGNHWCRLCNVICGHMFDFFKHLESKKHQQRLDPFERPWLIEALQKTEGKVKEGAVQAHPIKGLEFMMATSAFYCSLCKEFAGDVSVAETHMKSDEHHEKYREYIAQNPYYEKRYTLERSASLTLQKTSTPSDEESSDGGEEKQVKPKKKSTATSQAKEESQQVAKDCQERVRRESLEKQQVISSKTNEAKKKKSKESLETPVEDTKMDHTKDSSSRASQKTAKMPISNPEDIPLPLEESSSERREASAEDEKKEADTDSKGKIPIKLTGKSGIKPPAPAPVQPWKAFTRPIPKSKRLLPVKPAPATIASGNNSQPAPLDEFLTLGTKSSQPLPIVKDIFPAPAPKAPAPQPAPSAPGGPEQPPEPPPTVAPMSPEPLPPGTFSSSSPSVYAPPPISSTVPSVGAAAVNSGPVSIPSPVVNMSRPPPLLQPPPMMPCGPPVPQHSYQGPSPYQYFGAPMMGPAPWPPPMMPAPPPMGVCPPGSPQPPLPPYSTIPPLPPTSVPPPPFPSVNMPTPPPPLPTNAPVPPPPPPPLPPPEPMQSVEKEPSAVSGEDVKVKEGEQQTHAEGQLPSANKDLPLCEREVVELEDDESPLLHDVAILPPSGGETPRLEEPAVPLQDVLASANEGAQENMETSEPEPTDVLEEALPAVVEEMTAIAVEETPPPTEELLEAISEELLPVAEDKDLGCVDELSPPDSETTQSFSLEGTDLSTEVPPRVDVSPVSAAAASEESAPAPTEEPTPVVLEDAATYEGLEAAKQHTVESGSPDAATAAPSTPVLEQPVTCATEDRTGEMSPSPTRRPKTRSQTRNQPQTSPRLQTRYQTRRSQKAAGTPVTQPPEEGQVIRESEVEPIRCLEGSTTEAALVVETVSPGKDFALSTVAACSKAVAASSVVKSEADMSSDTEALVCQPVTRSRSAVPAHVSKETSLLVPEKPVKLAETSHCVLDLTKPPVDSSVSCEDDVEVESSSGVLAESLKAANNEAVAAHSPADSDASDDTIIVESSEAVSCEAEPQVVQPETPYTEIDPEESALNLTVASPVLKAASCRSIVQTEPEDLRAPAMPQDLSTSGSSRNRAVVDMPMDLSVRLATSESATSLLSISTTVSEDVQPFLESQPSPSAQISSSDTLHRTDSMDSSTVKDTLLCSTSGFGPSSSRLSMDQDLAMEASLMEDQSDQMPGSSPELGVDAEGDPVDFSLAPIDFEELADLDDAPSAAPAEDGGEREAAVDSTYPDTEEAGV